MTMLVVADDRRVVTVTGEDRATFLDAVLSQQVTGLEPGTRTGALWLDVHGATLAAMDLLVDPDLPELHLVVVPDHVEPVVEGLGGRTFLSQASFAATDHVVVAVRGDDVDGLLRDGMVRRSGGVLVADRPDGADVLGPRAEVDAWLAEHGLAPAGDLADLLDDEVRRGVPRAPFEVAGPHLPEELGLLPTHVHLAKGCYPGQEAVARMWMLGRPRRRLVVLSLDGAAQPGDEAGAGRDRWRITRTTRDGDHALALAPADVDVGSVVDADGWRAEVVRVVGAGLDQPGADPNVTRRRDRRG